MASDTPKRKRQSGNKANGQSSKKIKTAIHLQPEAHERLVLHAMKTRRTMTAVVEDLINTHLRRFVVSDRAGGAPAESAEGEGA